MSIFIYFYTTLLIKSCIFKVTNYDINLGYKKKKKAKPKQPKKPLLHKST